MPANYASDIEKCKFQKGRKQPGSNKTPAELSPLGASKGGTIAGELARGAKLLSEAYEIALEVPRENRLKPRTMAEQIAYALADAAGGANFNRFGEVVTDVSAARELREPTEGRVPDKHQMLGRNGKPIDPPAAVRFEVVPFTEEKN